MLHKTDMSDTATGFSCFIHSADTFEFKAKHHDTAWTTHFKSSEHLR